MGGIPITKKIVAVTKQSDRMYHHYLIKYCCYLFAFGLSLAWIIVFYFSYYFNDYTLAIHINLFGEAHIELVALTAVFVFITYGLYLIHMDMKRYKEVHRYRNRINR